MQVHMSPVRGFGGLRSRNRSLPRAGRMLSVMVGWAIWLLVAGCASTPVDPGDASSTPSVIAETQPDGTPVPQYVREAALFALEPAEPPLAERGDDHRGLASKSNAKNISFLMRWPKKRVLDQPLRDLFCLV